MVNSHLIRQADQETMPLRHFSMKLELESMSQDQYSSILNPLWLMKSDQGLTGNFSTLSNL